MEEVLTPVQEEAPQTLEVVDIQFRPGQKIYYFDPNGMQFAPGDHVIMDTARGVEFGICAGGNHIIPAKEAVAPLRKILRHASNQDERINDDNRTRERRAYEVCLQKIQHHQLDMQLVSAECAFDGSKILFYFTADERVDFRELVKDLASVFHTRIELRQIGVRDKAKMVGGLGICGRPFCCASFLDDFQPVSIKMAKTQSLSLNPTKISGTCGRLMCCLKYEQDTYESLIRTSPKMESFVDTPEGRGTVTEVDILRQRVKVQMENNPETTASFANEEIAVLRNGRAKKNDPPIPADLAPISGSGKRERRPKEEDAPVLEAIRFRYSTESIADAQQPVQEFPKEPTERPNRQNRRSNHRPREAQEELRPEQPESNRRPRKDRPRRPRPEQQAAPDAPKAEAPDSPRPEGQRQNRRNNRPNRKSPEQRPTGDTAPQNSSGAPTQAPQAQNAGSENRRPRRNQRNNRYRKPKSQGSKEE